MISSFHDFLELFTTLVSLATLWLGIAQYTATFPISIVITLLNMVVYYDSGRYESCASGVLSIAISCYVWHRWCYGGEHEGPLTKMRYTTTKERLLLPLFGFCFCLLCWPLLLLAKGKTPLTGSLHFTLIMIGNWMTAGKCVETYVIWFFANLLAIYNCYSSGNLFFVLKYTVYLFCSLYGFRTWWQQYQKQLRMDGC